MQHKSLSRRDFLRLGAMTAAGAVLASCAPAVVKEQVVVTQIVEKEGETVVQTVVTEVEVREEVIVTATPEQVEEGIDVETLGAGSIVINQWDGIGAADGLILTEMLKGFARENPEITVRRQIMPWGTYFDKLAAALVAGGGGPDVMVLWHSVMPQYAKAGFLYPAAEDLFNTGMVPEDDILPQLIDAITVDGTKWSMPLDNYGTGIYLNLDLLEQGGVDPASPPQDQAEWLEVCRSLTWDVNGYHPGDAGFDPGAVEVWGYDIGWPRAAVQPALYQWGADIISRDDPPKVLIDSAGAIEATQLFVDMVFDYQVAPPPAGFNAGEAFSNSKLAMHPDGSWMYNWFTLYPDLRAGIWPYPRLGPERGSTQMWSHTFAIAKAADGDTRDAALKLLQYLSDNSNIWTQKAGMPAARLSKREGLMDQVWTLPVFDAQFKKEGVMEFASDRFSEIMGAVEPEWSAALNQDKTVEEALGDAGDRIRQVLGQ